MERETKICPACGFTGAESLDMFGDNPPPLPPLLDVADLWSAEDRRAIHAEVARFQRRFPQIRWHICGVSLANDISLPLFDFWLLNVSPLAEGETADDRSWSVLLTMDAGSARASVTVGYRAEPWLSDDIWESALAVAKERLCEGQHGLAVVSFVKASRPYFEKAWHRSRKILSTPQIQR